MIDDFTLFEKLECTTIEVDDSNGYYAHKGIDQDGLRFELSHIVGQKLSKHQIRVEKYIFYKKKLYLQLMYITNCILKEEIEFYEELSRVMKREKPFSLEEILKINRDGVTTFLTEMSVKESVVVTEDFKKTLQDVYEKAQNAQKLIDEKVYEKLKPKIFEAAKNGDNNYKVPFALSYYVIDLLMKDGLSVEVDDESSRMSHVISGWEKQ